MEIRSFFDFTLLNMYMLHKNTQSIQFYACEVSLGGVVGKIHSLLMKNDSSVLLWENQQEKIKMGKNI